MAFINKKLYKIEKRDIGCSDLNLRKGEKVFEKIGYVHPKNVGRLCRKEKEEWVLQENKEKQ